jgi:hypothetical protein
MYQKAEFQNFQLTHARFLSMVLRVMGVTMTNTFQETGQ